MLKVAVIIAFYAGRTNVHHDGMIQTASAASRSNLRQAVRRNGCREATLIFDGFRHLDTLVKNWSARGARVDFEFAGAVPGFATLVAPSLGIRSDVQVIWQSGDRAGVCFLGRPVKR